LTEARAYRKRDAVDHTGARRLRALVVGDGQAARLCVQPLHCIETNANARRDEAAEEAVNACAKGDPLLRRFSVNIGGRARKRNG
jgi:hypothetical protein